MREYKRRSGQLLLERVQWAYYFYALEGWLQRLFRWKWLSGAACSKYATSIWEYCNWSGDLRPLRINKRESLSGLIRYNSQRIQSYQQTLKQNHTTIHTCNNMTIVHSPWYNIGTLLHPQSQASICIPDGKESCCSHHPSGHHQWGISPPHHLPSNATNSSYSHFLSYM